MYHKPIWITEFALNGNSQSDAYNYLRAAMNGLDKLDYVERYSWFNFDSNTYGGISTLWNKSNGSLTNMGSIYASIGNPTNDVDVSNEEYEFIAGPASIDPIKPQSVVITAPGKAKIKKLKNVKKKKIKVYIKKVSKAKGYQLKFSDNKKFDGYETKNTKKTTVTISGLDKNTRYYVKARAYVLNASKKKLYGKWGTAKSVKVKK